MRETGRQTCEIIDKPTEFDTETKICETSGAVDGAASVIASHNNNNNNNDDDDDDDENQQQQQQQHKL